uniref:Uncharacterized protein n=1 Tax=Arundo donax TaxID=35708 RepID=A0A0A8Y476_ARUDO
MPPLPAPPARRLARSNPSRRLEHRRLTWRICQAGQRRVPRSCRPPPA